jgi:hypothetical protein
MLRTPLTSVLRDPEPQRELLPPVQVMLGDDKPQSWMDGGARLTNQPSGGVVVDFAPRLRGNSNPNKSGAFDANLAEDMDDFELNRIASDLLAGIKADDDSRQEWLQSHAEGIDLLGFKIDKPRSSPGASSSPVENMSTAKHPLLAEACLMFQAQARGELLPAAGPVKVRDDRPDEPPMPAPPPMGPMGGASPFALPPPGGMAPQQPPSPMPAGVPSPPPPATGAPPDTAGAPLANPPMQEALPSPQARDALANALEKDFNHYLTTTATEYYPDSDRMYFTVGFGGQGIKKVYGCPLRRRPVSESVAMEDFIVSNALTDLRNAPRITHRITMRPSVLRRMQLLGVYLDIPLGTPPMQPTSNAVQDAKAATVGVTPTPPMSNPRDAEFELYECYCELELDEFAPRQFKGKGLALPYRVTIEKYSQRILEIRRNWREEDQECVAREFFVEFPYVKAFGFYGIGLLHILGNLTRTLTAIARIFVDRGMFANFPGFLFKKSLGRQITNQFRVPPGGGLPVDVGGMTSIRDGVMALPYSDLTPIFSQFSQHMEEMGQRLGGTANIGIGEGRQDAPVGTTLALIEQATKPIGAVLKRLHSGVSKELQLLKERFRDDPEAFWRYNPRPAMPWQKEQFIQALKDFDFVPVSDPNNPTTLHRTAKAEALKQVAVGAPGLLDPWKTFVRWASEMGIADVEDLKAPPMPPQAPPVDQAKMASVQAKLHGDQIRAQTDMATAQLDAQGKLAEIQARIKLALIEQETERLRLAGTFAIHSDKTAAAKEALSMNIASDHALDTVGRVHDMRMQDADQRHAALLQGADHQQAVRMQAMEPQPEAPSQS